MLLRALKAWVFISFLALAFAPRLTGQTMGAISGHIADPTGASLPHTEMTLTNVETTATRVTVSTDAGDYTFTAVPPGSYTLQAKHAGFKLTQSDVIEVQVQQSVKIDLMLQVGAVTETVEVQALGALLQSENASLGTVIEHAQLAELPLLNGRNYLGLVGLASNVNTQSPSSGQAGSRLGGERASESIAVGGQRIMFDYYTLDGVVNTDPDFNTYVAQPSPDGIGEFKVQTGVYSAEFGHEASQINVVSKSGTNTFHGVGYDYIRNNYVDAQPYFFPERNAPGTHQTVTPFKYNDFGGEVDGPIRIPKVYNGQDKFFFMVDTEWYRTRSSSKNNFATVPTPAIAGGNFQGLTYQYEDATGTVQTAPVVIYDPMTGAPFSNNTIPPGRIASQSTALLAYLGTAPASSSSPTTYQFNCAANSPNKNCTVIPNYQYSTLNNSNRYSITTRGDYNMSAKSQLSFRYTSGSENTLGVGLLGAGSKLITNYHQYMGSNTYTFLPSLVNEVRFGYSYLYNSLAPLQAFTKNVVDTLGIPGLVGGPPAQWGIPSMSFANAPGTPGLGTGSTPNLWSGFGDQGGDTPYVTQDPIWQIVDNVTWVKGKHSLRLGFEYNRQNFNEFGNQFLRGQFTSEPLTTSLLSGGKLVGGDALADFLLGNLQSSTVALAPANANYVRNAEAAYVDDTYKLSPKLTVSAGLRYELTPPWTDTLGDLFNTLVPVFPTATSVAGSVPTSQWPYPIRQGNCTPSGVYTGLPFNWTTNGPLPTCNNGMVPNGPMMDTHYTNVAPRFGVSYSPNARMVIRAGYGIFYTQDIGNAYFDMARNIAGRVSYTNQNSTQLGSASNLTWANVSPFSTPGTVSILPLATTWYANSVTHHTSYTQQMLLNIQQQIGKEWSIEVGYQGALSRHLYGFLNANQVTPFGLLPTAQSYTITSAATPTCPGCTKATATSVCSRTTFNCSGTGSPQGIQFVHDEGTANYNSGSFKVNRRFSRGVDLTASYTLSKSLDDSSGIRNQGNDNLYPQNSQCIPCEYGPSAFDVRNRISINGSYELPIGPDKLIRINNKAVNAAIGGWQLGGAFSHQTGAVATPLMGSDNAGIASPFGNFDRPNQTGISPYMPCNTHTRGNCANLAAYAKPGVVVTLTTQSPSTAPIITGPVTIGGLFGNAQRGSFHGPGYTNLNASLHKSFNMPYNEKHQLAIRFEVTNALNHPNWGTPNITFNSSAFGQVGAGGMRNMQLGAKYQF
jgi:Carboxypeptidase regulatory-like domain/TonB dependent receptor